MTKPVITETIFADDPTKVTGSMRLFAQDGGGGVAYTNAGTPVTLGGIIRISFDAAGVLKADDGLADLTLNPNSGSSDDAIVVPTGTVWEYEIKYPTVRTSDIRYITIPDGVGPYDVSAILTSQPGAIAQPGNKAYTDAAVATRVAVAGDTMTGQLTLARLASTPLIIPDVGNTYNALIYQAAAPDVNNPQFKLRASSTGVGTFSIFQVRDTGNAPIAWVLNAGGLSVNDMIRMVDDSGSYFNGIGFQYLNEASRKGFSLVFGHSGSTGSTFIDNAVSYSRDAFKAFYLRLNDSNQIVASTAVSVAAEGSLVPVVITPTAGPGAQPGISIGIATPARLWRAGNSAWGSDSSWDFQNGVGVSTAGTMPAAGGGLIWDGTLGFVLGAAGTARWRIGTSGNFLPYADNTYDLGATTAYVKTGYVHSVDLGNSGVYSSNGSPEGVTTGKPGSICEDYTNGVVYNKATGTGTTGWVPVVTGTNIAQTFPWRRMRSGNYTVPGGNTTTGTPAANTAVAIPFKPDTSVTLTRIGVNVTGTTATATARLGIYNDDGTGYPGTVLNDAGTVATATSGWKEITINQAVTAGTVYWLVYAAQTAAATITVINAGDWAPNVATSASMSSTDTGYSMTGVSGSFGTWSGTLAEFANSPRIAVKV